MNRYLFTGLWIMTFSVLSIFMSGAGETHPLNPPTTESGEALNLIPDGSFETGTDHWSPADDRASFVDTPVHSGNRALAIISDFDGHTRGMHNVVQQAIPGIVGGREYVYSVWCGGDRLAGIGNGGKPITELRWLDDHGKKIGRGLYMWAPYGTFPYQEMHIHAQAPQNAVQCELHFRSWWECTAGTSYWDDTALYLRDTGAGKGSLISLHEAENADTREGCEFDSAATGYTGAGYLKCEKEGSSIAWNVKPGVERCILVVRYAAEAGTRSCALSVDDAGQQSLQLVPTGAPASWATVSAAVHIRSSGCVIRLTSVTPRPGLSVDRLEVYAAL